MRKNIYFNPSEKVLDAVTQFLIERLRLLSVGCKSLGHILVIVPTAQSGRRLRRALALKCGSIVPPVIMQPAQLILPEDTSLLANNTDELLAFYSALGSQATLDLATQYVEVRRQLGANALMFSDVVSRLESILPAEIVDIEIDRWKSLAKLEEKYLKALEVRGKKDRILAMKEFAKNPTLPKDVEEVVLACVLDAIPALNHVLDGVKIPCIDLLPEPSSSEYLPLKKDQISASGTVIVECEKIADLFSSVSLEDELPSLCLADASIYQELQTSFSAKGLKVNHPARIPLSTSSLGHLVSQLASLLRFSSYLVFSAFIRGGDLRRYFQKELSISDDDYATALCALDDIQARILPECIEDLKNFLEGDLKRIYDRVQEFREKKDIREILRAIFSTLILDEHDSDAREFAAAAEVVNALLEECFNDAVPEDLRFELFAQRIEESSYSLESDDKDTIYFDGWLELPYVDKDELVIAGFQEGCVPEAIVGHAFLPDLLRKGLGLPCNESRAIRDQEILRLAIQCRAPEAVTITIHSIDVGGDVVRPSRLLFLCEDKNDLIERVKAFYKINSGIAPTRNPDLPENWRLKLDIPLERQTLISISPTMLDHYLMCPFTYFLDKTLGETRDDRAEELNAREFGDLVHNALERWGLSDLKDSENEEAIAKALAQNVDDLLAERFGVSVPTIVALQGESIKERLTNFATEQVKRYREGWRIVGLEEKLTVRYGDTIVKGRLDRIDYRPSTDEWCVIDYKTWDTAKLTNESVQLHLYVAMLDACSSGKYKSATRARISSCYCVLGATKENVLFSSQITGDALPEAEVIIRGAIDRIERGIFWPPSKGEFWRSSYGSIIFNSPEESVNTMWLEDQKRRVGDGEKCIN